MQVGDFSLPISMDPLPPGICYLSPLLNVPNVRWFDGHKCLFDVTLNLVSTVYPQVLYFFRIYIAYIYIYNRIFFRILNLTHFLIHIIYLNVSLNLIV